jgi:PAS domain S-box-containing protein
MSRDPVAALHLLLVQDKAQDSEHLSRELADALRSFTVTRVGTLGEAITRLRGGAIDVVLLDLALSDSRGLATFDRAQAAAGDVPIVVVSSTRDPKMAAAAVQAGAQDYLVRSEVSGAVVERVVRYAIDRRAAEVRRRQAEEAQRVSDERFRLLSSASNDTIWDWNVTTNELWWNENFQKVFGHSPAEVEPTLDSWTSRVHPQDLPEVLRALHATIDGGEELFAAEYRFKRKSGTYAYVFDRGHVIRDQWGAPVRMVGAMTDVTERYRALTRIAEQASLLDQARDAIIVRDLDHRIRYYNRSAERIYGWTAADVMGHSVRDRFFEDPAVFDAAMARLLQDGNWEGEVAVRGRDGARIFVDSHWTLTRDEHGEPRSVLVIDTDISEKKELERRFLRTQRMESLGTLAGGIAHDLNNMLAPVLMSIELLKDNPPGDERDVILSTIEASARRGAEMVRQVLTFARGVEGERTAVEVAALVHGVEKFANDTFMKNITVRSTLASGLPDVLGDVTQLHQVLMNLCVNARDAMPNGGTLTIAAGVETLDKIDPGLDAPARPGRYVAIRVSDTGTGIPAGILDRIYEPFFTSKPTGQGTGLGLSTSSAIVKSHGGLMRVDTEVGRGSTFTVYLPAQEKVARAAAPHPLAAPQLARGSGEVVLVVDDEQPLLRMSSLVLESFGYRVLLAESGAEAVSVFQAHRGDIKVVITDMTMPIMDGATVIRKIREIDPDARIIAASGLDGQEAARLPGVMRFLPKPLTADTLMRAVSDAVRA